MPVSNPWLSGPSPDRDLPRELLEERILNLLSSHNTAVIATTDRFGGPAATPVRYSSLGLELMFTTWDESPKARNLRRDPRISVGVVAPLVGQASSRGLQMFGQAWILRRDDPASEPYWEAFRWQSDHVERGRDLAEPPQDPLVVVTPHRVVYTEHWLRRSGYRPRQIWRSPDAPAATDAGPVPAGRAEIVCLCGAARFTDELAAVSRELTLAGAIVLAPVALERAPDDDERAALGLLHLQRIDLADRVVVVNPGGYVGDAVAREIAHARAAGTPVTFTHA